MYTSTQVRFGRFPGGGLGCFIFLVLLFVAAFYILKGLYYLLWWAAPALIVLTLVVNWRIIPETISKWLDTLESRPVNALFNAAIAVLAFPFFALWLFLKALGSHRKPPQRPQDTYSYSNPNQDEYTDFEEIESAPPGEKPEPEAMNPPDIPEKEKKKKNDNPYDTFFNE